MWKFLIAVGGLVLAGCAQVPLSADGRVIVPDTANFATEARTGTLDGALDELIVKVQPGAEEVRAVALVSMAVLVACEINNCRRNRSSSARRNVGLSVALNGSSRTDTALSQLEAYERTDLQIQELTKLAEAMAVIAERDSAALETATSVDKADSWVALYAARKARLDAAQAAVLKQRETLQGVVNGLPKSRTGRLLQGEIRALISSASQNAGQIGASTQRLGRALDAMNRIANARQDGG